MVDQVFNTKAGDRAGFHDLGCSAPLCGRQLVFGKLPINTINIDTRNVNFVQRHNNGYTGCLGMVNRLNRLRHHAVISSNHQHNNIGHVGSACPHCGKGFVARRVKEGYSFAVQLNLVGPDVLCNPASLTGSDTAFTNSIQQTGFAVVHMAQHRHNRWTLDKFGSRAILELLFDFIEKTLFMLNDQFRAEIQRNQFSHISRDNMIRRCQDSLAHQLFNNIADLDRQCRRQIFDCNRFGNSSFFRTLDRCNVSGLS